MKSIDSILAYIAKTTLFGFLPLDVICHYLVGVALTILFLKLFKNNLIFAFLFVLILELLKEYYDSFTMTANWLESIKDICVTIIHPVMLMIVRKVTKKPLTGSLGYYR